MAEFRGPFFQTDPVRIVQTHLEQMRLVVADIAETRVRTHLSQHQRVQTGYNVSHVQTQNRSADITAVKQTNATYGPWIEGTGSRNKTTRFKGYHTFRTIGQEMRGRVHSIIAPHVKAMISDLNH